MGDEEWRSQHAWEEEEGRAEEGIESAEDEEANRHKEGEA